MKKYILYLGLSDKDSKIQKISTIESYKIVENVLKKVVDGATIYEATGLYKHENGTFITESTLRIELLFTDEKTVMNIVSQLKTIFNQESIILQVESINSKLV